ncbi:MAG: 50S ribosomal protein L11 [Nanoarchaeota archaeon]
MAKETVKVMVEGGKATAAPPLGPALGPLGINIGLVVSEINKKTATFKGMQVPVNVTVETDTKEFTITVGTPPASQLILKEAGVQKGSGSPKAEKVADLRIEQIIKIAKMKEDAMLGKTLKEKIKEVIGTCQSMGILVQGVPAHDAIAMVGQGTFDVEIKEEKTELTQEELAQLQEEKRKLAAEIERRRVEFEARAKAILEEMKEKPRGQIKTKMVEAGVPQKIIDELLPVEAKADEKGGAAAAAGGKAAAPAKKA